MDLYRLKSEADALDIGIEDYLFSNEYCFIEWPQIIENLLPENIKKIDIQINEDLSRKIILL
jgi:tRNA threonylcarbamoyladenosine biosynthesis protein TsaE